VHDVATVYSGNVQRSREKLLEKEIVTLFITFILIVKIGTEIHKILVRKLSRNRPLWRPRCSCRYEDNIYIVMTVTKIPVS